MLQFKSQHAYRNKGILFKHGLIDSIHVDNAIYEEKMSSLDSMTKTNWTFEHCSLEDQLDSVSIVIQR